jgi:hypothetical protein
MRFWGFAGGFGARDDIFSHASNAALCADAHYAIRPI